MEGPPAGGGGPVLGFFCTVSDCLGGETKRQTFFFFMNNTSSAARVGGGGGGGRPGGGAGRGKPFGGFVPLPLVTGRVGAETVDAFGLSPFIWGFFASGIGADDDTSDGRFEGTTLGGKARSFCLSGRES